MADKLTPLILDALARAAADPAGAPLYSSKTDPGLFPLSSAAKPAAKKCLDDGLLQLCRTDLKGKTARELYAVTDKGMNYLVEHASPKQVIDDFVRILEERRGDVRGLLSEAKRIADGIDGLMGVVARLGEPAPQGPWVSSDPPAGLAAGVRQESDLPTLLLNALTRWSAAASVARDCPLPDLYRALPAPPGVGAFHDALRRLHADARIYLHPWTGPLYALPEPVFALLVGHEIAYYVSPR